MTIFNYIEKHGLKLSQKWPEDGGHVPLVLIEAQKGSAPFSKSDQFEIYKNAEKDHCVSLNKTSQQFRIVRFEDIGVLASDWMSARMNYA